MFCYPLNPFNEPELKPIDWFFLLYKTTNDLINPKSIQFSVIFIIIIIIIEIISCKPLNTI